MRAARSGSAGARRAAPTAVTSAVAASSSGTAAESAGPGPGVARSHTLLIGRVPRQRSPDVFGGSENGAQARRQLRTTHGSGGLRRLLPGDARTAGAEAAGTRAAHVRTRPVPRPVTVRSLPRGRAGLRLRGGDGCVDGLTGGAGGGQGHPQLRHRRGDVRALRRPAGGLTPVNGAQALIRTLVDAGVDVCFANPGTSEMHFVAAL